MDKEVSMRLTKQYWENYKDSDNKISFISNLIDVKKELSNTIKENISGLKSYRKDLKERYKQQPKSELSMRLDRYYRLSICGEDLSKGERDTISTLLKQSSLNETLINDITKFLNTLDRLSERVIRKKNIENFIEQMEKNGFPAVSKEQNSTSKKGPNIQGIIKNIAKRRANKDSAEYSNKMFELYLTVHNDIKSSVSEERKEALKRVSSESVENELIEVGDGILYDLRTVLKDTLEQYSQVFPKN